MIASAESPVLHVPHSITSVTTAGNLAVMTTHHEKFLRERGAFTQGVAYTTRPSKNTRACTHTAPIKNGCASMNMNWAASKGSQANSMGSSSFC